MIHDKTLWMRHRSDSHWLLTVEAWLWTQGIPYGIYGWHNSNEPVLQVSPIMQPMLHTHSSNIRVQYNKHISNHSTKGLNLNPS